MSWRMDSTAGAAIWDTQPLSDEGLLCRDEEIRWLMRKAKDGQRKQWGLINGRLAQGGELVAMAGGMNAGYATIHAEPPTSATQFLANVASLNGEAALWNSNFYTPWLAGELVAPTAWKLHAAWQMATSTSPASLTINPRVGALTAGASSTGGIALGADAAISLTASITTDWITDGHITVGLIGAPGTNSKAIGDFITVAKPGTSGTGPATINDIYGYTQASFDASINSGVVLGMANTVTSITFALMQIHWLSLN